MQMILSGEPIDAAAALRAGLVSEVVPPELLLDRAIEIATRIAGHSLIALRAAKRAVLHSTESSLGAGLDFEREALRKPFASEDRREGMAAFLERRPPVFRNR